MTTEQFSELLEHPEHISGDDAIALNSLLKDYPYFQSARALHLKALKNADSYKYNNSLKLTAAHTTDRSVLFDFITSAVFNQNAISQNIKQNTEYLKALELSEVDDISVNKSVLIDEALKTHIQSTEGVLDPDLFQKKGETTFEELPAILDVDVQNISPEEQLNLGKPLEFDTNETHSFAEWLKITDFKPIDRGETQIPEDQSSKEVSKTAPISSKLELIDKFIEGNPKIVPKEEPIVLSLNQQPSLSEEGLMTETLARIYLEQKNYDKALQSYRILSLKYPEKSTFFADQIKAIKEIQSRNI